MALDWEEEYRFYKEYGNEPHFVRVEGYAYDCEEECSRCEAYLKPGEEAVLLQKDWAKKRKLTPGIWCSTCWPQNSELVLCYLQWGKPIEA